MTFEEYLAGIGYKGYENEDGSTSWIDTEGNRHRGDGDGAGPVDDLLPYYYDYNRFDPEGRPIFGTNVMRPRNGADTIFVDANGMQRYRVGTHELTDELRAIGAEDGDLTYDPVYGYSIPYELQVKWSNSFQQPSFLDNIASNGPMIIGGIALGAIAGGALGGGGIESGVNVGGLDGALADTAANYSAGMGASNPLSGLTPSVSDARGLLQMGTDTGMGGDNLSQFVNNGGVSTPSVTPSGGGVETAADLASQGRDPITAADATQPWTTNPSVESLGGGTPSATPASGGGFLGRALDFIRANPTAASIGGQLISGIIKGATDPAIERERGRIRAETELEIADRNRRNTSFAGVNFGVSPSGTMLRNSSIRPGILQRR